MSETSYEKLLTEIRDEQVKELDLRFLTVGEDRICELVKEIKGKNSVKKVWLGVCELGPRFAGVLSDVLKVNTSVTDFDLWKNNLGDEGSKTIAEALKGNQFVKEVYLGSNNIGPEGAKAIGGMLCVNKTLK